MDEQRKHVSSLLFRVNEFTIKMWEAKLIISLTLLISRSYPLQSGRLHETTMPTHVGHFLAGSKRRAPTPPHRRQPSHPPRIVSCHPNETILIER